jgi:hypothetical protein
MYYLRHTYTLPLHNPNSYDHVGPFGTEGDAKQHQNAWGPIAAEVVNLDYSPEPRMTPQEHVSYMLGRA